jgi:hypothetical protein
LLLLVMLTVDCAAAQDAQKSEPAMTMADMNPASMFLMNLASGTSANPASWPMPMIMTHYRNWNTMFMGIGFLADIQQSGPRGGDKLYSTNWSMAAADVAMAELREMIAEEDSELSFPCDEAGAAPPNHEIDPRYLVALSNVDLRNIADGALDIEGRSAALMNVAGDVIRWVANKGGHAPDAVIREVHQYAMAAAKQLGLEVADQNLWVRVLHDNAKIARLEKSRRFMERLKSVAEHAEALQATKPPSSSPAKTPSSTPDNGSGN